jgi:hypothetical protein
MNETSINSTVSGGAVGVVAQHVQIEKLYVGGPESSAREQVDLGIARIFQTRTRAFTDEYLVSETGPVPFGGRDDELRRLDQWLSDPKAAPRMLLSAPAGRGKSALLVRWLKNANSDLSRPGIPIPFRPAFRFEAGHHSEMKPAT